MEWKIEEPKIKPCVRGLQSVMTHKAGFFLRKLFRNEQLFLCAMTVWNRLTHKKHTQQQALTFA